MSGSETPPPLRDAPLCEAMVTGGVGLDLDGEYSSLVRGESESEDISMRADGSCKKSPRRGGCRIDKMGAISGTSCHALGRLMGTTSSRVDTSRKNPTITTNYPLRTQGRVLASARLVGVRADADSWRESDTTRRVS